MNLRFILLNLLAAGMYAQSIIIPWKWPVDVFSLVVGSQVLDLRARAWDLSGWKPPRLYNNLDGNLVFDFPIDSYRLSTAGYLTTNSPVRNLTGRTLSITAQIIQSPDTIYNWTTFAPDNTSPAPAKATIYFARYPLKLIDIYGRWWATGDTILLANGTFTVTIPIDPARWTSVLGAVGTSVPSEWSATIQDVGDIGMTFGGGCCAGHSINLLQGQSQFRLVRYEIQ